MCGFVPLARQRIHDITDPSRDLDRNIEACIRTQKDPENHRRAPAKNMGAAAIVVERLLEEAYDNRQRRH